MGAQWLYHGPCWNGALVVCLGAEQGISRDDIRTFAVALVNRFNSGTVYLVRKRRSVVDGGGYGQLLRSMDVDLELMLH